MTLSIYNTAAREKQDFIPHDKNRVTMYNCGPTVYSYAHIGNGRAAVTSDILYRLLCYHFGKDHVVYARNITDIDDKINASAKEQGVDISVITQKFTKIYHEDMGALNVLSPNIEPKATDTIETMINMIRGLIEKGHAYEAEGHVLFNVNSFDDYGSLSRHDRDEIIAGARVEVAPYKKDPADFVLWKPSSDDLPGWDSPWGRGRPGWHLECSAMIEKHLGNTIDIHTGGQDLTFPHHENEIAQSTCSHDGEQFVRYWVHNGFLTMKNEKMSKSLGNVLLVHDLIKEHPGEVIRLAIMSAHYRQPLVWSQDVIEQAKKNLDRLYQTLLDLKSVDVKPKAPRQVLDALNDDMNTPQAMAGLFEILKDKTLNDTDKKSFLLGAGNLLGILEQDAQAWFDQKKQDINIDEAEILSLIEQRKEARLAKDFALSDQIRDDLLAKGIILEDSPEGTTWKPA